MRALIELVSLWFVPRDPVSRRAYLLSGLGLAAFKIGVESITTWQLTGQPLTPAVFISPSFAVRRSVVVAGNAGTPARVELAGDARAGLPAGSAQAGRSSHIGHQSGCRGKSWPASRCAICVEGPILPAATASTGSHCPSSRRASSSSESFR